MTFGVVGGIGLAFHTFPISVLVKWFPDHRGLMTALPWEASEPEH